MSRENLNPQLEPLFTGEEWPSGKTKKEYLRNPTLLATSAPECFDQRKHRRVYLDLGARNFDSSVGWFKTNYPQANTFRIHAFEIEKRYRKDYKNTGVNFHNVGVHTRDGFMVVKEKEMKHLEHLEQGSFSRQVQTINISRWILETLPSYDPSVFVVVKMDVEGMEHEIIPQLFETGAICAIDELFLECHYTRRGVRNYGQGAIPCDPYNKSDLCLRRPECVTMLQTLRDSGVYAHEWR